MEKEVDVLVVEDSDDDYEIVSHVFDDEHVRYLHVKNGPDALRYIFSARPAHEVHDELGVILLDLKLPKISGLEVLKKIRTDKRTHNIPVVIFSSTDDTREIGQAYELGANGFVVKPMGFEKFVSTVKAISMYWIGVNRKSV